MKKKILLAAAVFVLSCSVVVMADEPVELLANLPERPAAMIRIPAIGLVRPVDVLLFGNGTWDPRDVFRVWHLQGTASLGNGNTVIVGHRTMPVDGSPGPFYHLNLVGRGNLIYVYDEDFVLHTYVVADIFLVEPEETWVVASSAEPKLTLLTCHNWDGAKYTHRLIIIGRPFEYWGAIPVG